MMNGEEPDYNILDTFIEIYGMHEKDLCDKLNKIA
jgi:hypothetical protein